MDTRLILSIAMILSDTERRDATEAHYPVDLGSYTLVPFDLERPFCMGMFLVGLGPSIFFNFFGSTTYTHTA